MTADSDCHLGGDAGNLLFHTCRGVRGYSSAPILVISPDNEVRIAGIHIAMTRRNGMSSPRPQTAVEPRRQLADADFRDDVPNPRVLSGIPD